MRFDSFPMLNEFISTRQRKMSKCATAAGGAVRRRKKFVAFDLFIFREMLHFPYIFPEKRYIRLVYFRKNVTILFISETNPEGEDII